MWASSRAAWRRVPAAPRGWGPALCTRRLMGDAPYAGAPHVSACKGWKSRAHGFNGSAEDHRRCDDGPFDRQLRADIGLRRCRGGGFGPRQIRMSELLAKRDSSRQARDEDEAGAGTTSHNCDWGAPDRHDSCPSFTRPGSNCRRWARVRRLPKYEAGEQ